MKVFVFDLLAYGENLDHLKTGTELPYPLSKRHFKSDVAVRTYAEHLDAWEELDRLGYDGVGFNEHHCSPYGLMNSPNLMAAALARRTPNNSALMVLGNVQAGLKQRGEAIASYREAVAIYRASIGETHPNTLRTSYNLAEMLAQDAGLRAEALMLYQSTLAAAEQRFGAKSNAVVLFRLGYARNLLADGEAAAALDVLTTPAAASGLAIARTENRRDFVELLRQGQAAAGCADTPAQPAERCDRAATLMKSVE